MKSIILTHSGYQDQEVFYPYHRLREEDIAQRPIIVAEKQGPIRGILGTEIEAAQSLLSLQLPNAFTEYDLLVLPGGVKAMEKLRQSPTALAFVAYWFAQDKPTASLCSGAQMLISARCNLHGRRVAAYPAMQADVENAGAIYFNEPVIVDRNLVSSPHYKYLAEFMRAAINLVYPGPAILSSTVKK